MCIRDRYYRVFPREDIKQMLIRAIDDIVENCTLDNGLLYYKAVSYPHLGVMALRDALKMAKDAGVDLVMVSPSANPPVCRIVDYGKFKYEQLRREKEAKKKHKTVEVKEVRLSPNIDVNDLNTKCNSARKFIEKGNKVKVSLRFRGREMAHIDSTKHILEDFAEKLGDIAVIEKAPKMEGRSMMMFLTEKR